ncbi:hypothetical protein DIE04_18990 [Burkholderia sp. Bp8994]|uniref:excisionase n=1 Tax=Burkholderia sp. Bp8994 TaxID=2184555 RepID=UPI000F5B3D4E|nr:excisionase [Burkholderia sp. Bp8994]RQR94542.1 hypothetical protein DIE04_18990 [Burkholderia sp. Bp8994]
MTQQEDDRWMPLKDAASIMNRSLSRIRSQMLNGRLQRGRHFRRIGDGEFELNVTEYLRWLEEEKETRKLPLFERVARDIENGRGRVQAALDSAPKTRPPTSAATKHKPKLIPLQVWAEQTFGEYAPHRNTLLSWVKNGKICPFPKKVGRRYFVTPEAEYIDPVAQKIQRMIDGH